MDRSGWGSKVGGVTPVWEMVQLKAVDGSSGETRWESSIASGVKRKLWTQSSLHASTREERTLAGDVDVCEFAGMAEERERISWAEGGGGKVSGITGRERECGPLHTSCRRVG